jgi:hypothetical protein
MLVILGAAKTTPTWVTSIHIESSFSNRKMRTD